MTRTARHILRQADIFEAALDAALAAAASASTKVQSVKGRRSGLSSYTVEQENSELQAFHNAIDTYTDAAHTGEVWA